MDHCSDFAAAFKKSFLCSILAVSFALSQTAPTKIHGLDPKNIDPSVKPCDNFYLYANGAWLKNAQIPPAFSSWGSFTELAEQNNDVLHEILESASKDPHAPAGSNEQKIGDLYATGMDSAAIEHLGANPLAPDLAQIDAIKDDEGVQAEIARLHLYGNGPVFGFGAAQDAKNSKQVIGQLSQGGLTLPDRDYYLADDEKSKNIREEYVKHMAAMFALAGDDAAASQAETKAVMAIETRFAKASRTRVERRDPDKNYNKMTQEQIASLTPNFAWPRFFAAMGVTQPGDVNVGQPEFFKEVNIMLKDVPLADWKSYFRWRVINGAANALSSPFVAESFHFNGTVLTGTKEQQARWKRIVQVVNGTLGEALGEVYVAKAFSPTAKAHAKEMVKNLMAALRDHIKAADWMDETTREAALKKLEAINVKIGYPDKWRDYSGLRIDRTSYFENLRRAREFDYRYNIAKIGKPVDPTEWGMTPPTVNAYYSSSRNEIVFPAGILQPPFYDPDADDAVNYGGMGAVIGHELSHGFDDQGSKFDADGNLRMWWTPETRKTFEQRTGLVVKQFDGFVAIDSLHVNGKLTLGENIGDLGGLTVSYTALEKSLEGKPRQLIDGFTPEQRFFLAWAQIWRRKSRPEALRLQVRTDPHSPSEFRTNGPISNMKEFYEAFGCGDTSPMVRPEQERAKIW